MSALPAALIAAPRVMLPDRSGYLVMLPFEGSAVECPCCADGRALGLAILRQAMPAGTWSYSCLACAGPRVEVAA